MKFRWFASRRAPAIALGVGLAALGATEIVAQTQTPAPRTAPAAAAKPAGIPRTPWRAPDLNGVWTGNTMTPLERPVKYANKPVLTEEEAAALEKDQAQNA